VVRESKSGDLLAFLRGVREKELFEAWFFDGQIVVKGVRNAVP
jgi:hypothetical protein